MRVIKLKRVSCYTHIVPIGCFSGAGMKKVVVNSCPHHHNIIIKLFTKLKGNHELFYHKMFTPRKFEAIRYSNSTWSLMVLSFKYKIKNKVELLEKNRLFDKTLGLMINIYVMHYLYLLISEHPCKQVFSDININFIDLLLST